MNEILYLNGKLNKRSNESHPGFPALPQGATVSTSKILKLNSELLDIIKFWKDNQGFKPLISVFYCDIVAKSNRIQKLLAYGSKSPNDTIVGAKFSARLKHIITHCISIECLCSTEENLRRVAEIVNTNFGGEICAEDLIKLDKNKIQFKSRAISKSAFAQIIKDSFYIEKFGLPQETVEKNITDSQIVTLYDTGLSFEELTKILNFNAGAFDKLDDTSWLLTERQYNELYGKAPFLISCSLCDLRTISTIDTNSQVFKNIHTIPDPTCEPIIGVIDTLFDTNVYFSKWVDYRMLLAEGIAPEPDDYNHGTEVTSLIVDGPALNPELDDGCGRFRVRHFGVAKNGKNSSMFIIKSIRKIIEENRDIKVWNLSLGSILEINENSISPEAAALDELQYEYDVIFVVSGTNNTDNTKKYPRIGIPADSLNSVVVNSANLNGEPANYSRKGPVLHFFNKPDVVAFGGTEGYKIKVMSPAGVCKIMGTSFSAAWITRKLAYLIYIMKFPREIAKALILDSAAGWAIDRNNQSLKGFGLVPLKINDILTSKDNEIKFIIYGSSDTYDTYAYNIPVPSVNNKYPYICKATLCYFPKCSIKQGVDYTDTELDIHFGRVHEGKIKSIDNNKQGNAEYIRLREKNARLLYGKWDNTKYISEGIKEKNRTKKKYEDSSYWGLSVLSKERLTNKKGNPLHFGVVITLKEIENKNRINEFIRLCSANNWFVNKIDIETMVQTYIEEEEEIVFDD